MAISSDLRKMVATNAMDFFNFELEVFVFLSLLQLWHLFLFPPPVRALLVAALVEGRHGLIGRPEEKK